MEKGEIYDEIFDLKPIFPEIYSNRSIKPQISDNGRTSSSSPKINHMHLNNNNNNNSPICSWNSSSDSTSAAPKLISFESSNSTVDMDHKSNLETINFSSSSAKDDDSSCSNEEDHQYNIPPPPPPQYYCSSKQLKMRMNSAATRTPSQAQEHVVAERKRRETLSQLFISLSKVVPGLKKLDKASLLEDGIKYVKDLQERVRVLEEEEERRRSIDDEAVARSRSIVDESECKGSAEIEARIWEKQHVLIKIFCKNNNNNNKGSLMSRIPSEMMEMHLNVVDIRIMPFGVGGTSLHITILAQIQSEFEGAVKDIVDHLHTLFLN